MKYIAVEFEFVSDRRLGKVVDLLQSKGFDFNHDGPWGDGYLHSCQLYESKEDTEAEISYFLDCLESFSAEVQADFREARGKVADSGFTEERGTELFCLRHTISLPLLKRMVEWDLSLAFSNYSD